MKKEICIIGLGKMGGGLALNMKDHGWRVVGYNRTPTVTEEYVKEGIEGIYDLKELVTKLEKPRIVWLMLTAGKPVEETLFGESGLINILEEGDIVIEGGNSFFKDDAKNAERLNEKGIKYIDVGVSGGPGGARNGACCMIGGDKEIFEYLEELFKDISKPNASKFFPGSGAGHFVKMVHNGIEYGMMQAIGEGFNVLKKSDYNLNLDDVVDIYNNGSVIESRLINWLKMGYEKYGQNLDEISGSIAHSGEGMWTVQTAKEMGEEVPIIEGSLNYRIESQKNPNYIGKVVSVLRNMFGQHDVAVKK